MVRELGIGNLLQIKSSVHAEERSHERKSRSISQQPESKHRLINEKRARMFPSKNTVQPEESKPSALTILEQLL